MKNISKLLIAIFAVASAFLISSSFSDSYSLTHPLEFAEIMKPKSGYSIIAVTGESFTTLTPDTAIITLSIHNPPTNLRDAVDEYEKNIRSITDNLNEQLIDIDDVTISYVQTSFDGNHYRHGGFDSSVDSYVAYMSFPVKVEMEKYQNISQEISDLGLQIDDIRISQIPVANPQTENDGGDDTLPSKVSIAYNSGVPSCEITNECFLPADIDVNPGTEIIWLNDDQSAHTITSGTPEDGPDGIFDSGLFMSGTEFSYQFDSPGHYPYFCLVHPWMVGSVSILGDASDLGYVLEATINVRLETQPDTLENTLSAYERTLDDLSALLAENDVSGEIPRSTVNINPSFYPQGNYDNYQTYSRWTVKTSLDNLDAVYGILSEHGGVERMYLSNSKSSIDAVREKLTHAALDDARKNVLSIIEPMNLEIKGIKNIQVNPDYTQQNYERVHYGGVFISHDDWNNIRDGNVSVVVDVEFEVGH